MIHRHRLSQHLILLVAALSLGACAWMPKLKFWGDSYEFPVGDVKVWELRRALLCGTPTEDAVVRLFDNAQALQDWDTNNSLQLARVELPEARSFVLLEQGLRRTGGYSVEINRTAAVDEQGTIKLQAEWLEPGPDRMVTQMMTSLCVLVAVDPMPYKRVEVRDTSGKLKAALDPVRD